MPHIMNKHRGFTLVELIVVIAILAILAGILVPSILGFIESARLTADKSAVKVLNTVTPLFRHFVETADPFEDNNNDSDTLMQKLVDDRYILEAAAPQTKNAQFAWDFSKQVWLLFIDDAPVALSPLGSSFEEVSSGMISMILKKLESTGYYGRTWGDYRYTDIGLDPDDWKKPIQHVFYKPVGSSLRICPENGYVFIVMDVFGAERKIYASYNWDLIYSDLDKKWYYHSIATENEIDITTLQISKSS